MSRNSPVVGNTPTIQVEVFCPKSPNDDQCTRDCNFVGSKTIGGFLWLPFEKGQVEARVLQKIMHGKKTALIIANFGAFKLLFVHGFPSLDRTNEEKFCKAKTDAMTNTNKSTIMRAIIANHVDVKWSHKKVRHYISRFPDLH